MPSNQNTAIPHRYLIELLLLTGIPIRTDKTLITSITDILYEYEFNLHNTAVYDEIETEMRTSPSCALMMDKNSTTYRVNFSIAKPKNRQPIYVDSEVMAEYPMPETAVDLMHKFHGLPRSQTKQGRNIVMIINDPHYRQCIEVMLTRGVPLASIASYLNEKPHPLIRVTAQDIRFYYYYVWKWSPQEESLGEPLRNLYNYIFINMDSQYYQAHRKMLSCLDLDEILVWMASYGEAERQYINKKIYGLTSTAILSNLRSGRRTEMVTFNMFAHTDSSIAEEKKNRDNDDLRAKIDNLFSSVSTISQKRYSMSELTGKYTDKGEQEPDEPAEIKRTTANKK